MRIIKQYPLKETEKTCSNCKCEFAYTEKDLEVEDTDMDTYEFVWCPSCGGCIFIGWI